MNKSTENYDRFIEYERLEFVRQSEEFKDYKAVACSKCFKRMFWVNRDPIGLEGYVPWLICEKCFNFRVDIERENMKIKKIEKS